MAKKFKPTENKPLAEAFRELRKGSRTSPHETRNKRERTKERVIRAELNREGLQQHERQLYPRTVRGASVGHSYRRSSSNDPRHLVLC